MNVRTARAYVRACVHVCMCACLAEQRACACPEGREREPAHTHHTVTDTRVAHKTRVIYAQEKAAGAGSCHTHRGGRGWEKLHARSSDVVRPYCLTQCCPDPTRVPGICQGPLALGSVLAALILICVARAEVTDLCQDRHWQLRSLVSVLAQLCLAKARLGGLMLI